WQRREEPGGRGRRLGFALPAWDLAGVLVFVAGSSWRGPPPAPTGSALASASASPSITPDPDAAPAAVTSAEPDAAAPAAVASVAPPRSSSARAADPPAMTSAPRARPI